MKIIITIKERIYLTNILNGFKGSLSGLVYIMEDLKKLSLSEEVIKEINLREEPKGSGSIRWDKEKDEEIELSTHTIEFIKDHIKTKNDKNEITMSDYALISIKEKIEK